MRSKKMGNANLFQKCTGLTAMFLAISFIIKGMDSFSIFLASLFLFSICLTDMLWMKIPNIINFILIIAALGYHLHFSGTSGLFHALTGLIAGLSLLLIPYLFGGMGAGDVKALGALGAMTGATAIFQIFLYTSLTGGIIAILFYLFSIRVSQNISTGWKALMLALYTKELHHLKPAPSNTRLPYAAAIAFGYFAYVHFGNIV
jgi:prepilin peptidase CpaA